MTWLYEGKPYTLPDDFTTDDYYGFVYLITNSFGLKKPYLKLKLVKEERSHTLNQIGNHIMDLIEF
jgi:hypothetical protein